MVCEYDGRLMPSLPSQTMSVPIATIKDGKIHTINFGGIQEVVRKSSLMEVLAMMNTVVNHESLQIEKSLYRDFLQGVVDPIHLLHTTFYYAQNLHDFYEACDCLAVVKNHDSINRLVEKSLHGVIPLMYLLMTILPPKDSVYQQFWDDHRAWMHRQTWDVSLISGTGHVCEDMFFNLMLPLAERPLCKTYSYARMGYLFQDPHCIEKALPDLWNHPDHNLVKHNHDYLNAIHNIDISCLEEDIQKKWMALGYHISDNSDLYHHYKTLYEMGVRYEQLPPLTTSPNEILLLTNL